MSTIASSVRTLAVGSVSFLNARPLIYGLESADDLKLSLDVPAKLLEGLRSERYAVALLPVVDYQRMENLCIVPSGGIGCDGPTMTVRLFSQQPIRETRVLACDPDSHTSVALARIILSERFGISPEFIDLQDSCGGAGEARLLIGDKVVCEEPAGFEHQLDLGAAWKEMTGLPFVFAVWIARQKDSKGGIDLGDLPARLSEAKRAGLANVREIVTKYAIPRGWPAGMALQYLTLYLKYDIGPTQLQAISLFHEKAAGHGIISANPAPLRLYRAS
ncbi:MAG: menaquinone biosynthesis protein [Anaerolineae bacterium]|nr:menaquinone biosynthesis protein [Phycisphaerae bacterium]